MALVDKSKLSAFVSCRRQIKAVIAKDASKFEDKIALQAPRVAPGLQPAVWGRKPVSVRQLTKR